MGRRLKKGMNKSEVVTFRIDPRLKFYTEIAADAERRSFSSLIEIAIEKYIHNHPSYQENLWHVNKFKRLLKMRQENFPHMSIFDQKILDFIDTHKVFHGDEGYNLDLIDYFWSEIEVFLSFDSSYDDLNLLLQKAEEARIRWEK